MMTQTEAAVRDEDQGFPAPAHPLNEQDEHGHHVGATHHLALLNHPDVYERLRGWLARPGREHAAAP
jgi:hypothetical protein